MSNEAPRIWRAHHNGGLQFQASIEDGFLRLPWTGKRLVIPEDQEEMRGQLRQVGFKEEAVENLMCWIYGISAETPVAMPEIVESLSELIGVEVRK